MFLDTNVLVYATGSDVQYGRKYEIALGLLNDPMGNYFISNQIINEYFRVTTSRNTLENCLTIDQAIKNIKRFLSISSLITIPPYTLFSFEDDIKKYKILRRMIFDYCIYYTMKQHEILRIITCNEKDFVQFEGIEIINPFKE